MSQPLGEGGDCDAGKFGAMSGTLCCTCACLMDRLDSMKNRRERTELRNRTRTRARARARAQDEDKDEDGYSV